MSCGNYFCNFHSSHCTLLREVLLVFFFGKVYTYTFEKIRAKTAAYHVNFQFQMRDMEKSLSGCAASTLSFHDSTLTSKLIKSAKTYILTHLEIHFEWITQMAITPWQYKGYIMTWFLVTLIAHVLHEGTHVFGALVSYYCLACVAGVWKGRERGLWEREF